MTVDYPFSLAQLAQILSALECAPQPQHQALHITLFIAVSYGLLSLYYPLK